MNKHKVYLVPAAEHYLGTALVAADSVEEANRFIEEFQQKDPKNENDSGGYRYVDTRHEIEDVFAVRKGIIRYGIYYYG